MSDNKTIYAKLTPIIYNVNYHIQILDDYDESTPLVNNNPTYFTKEDTITFETASCGDLKFNGWYLDSEHSISARTINNSSFSYYLMLMDESNTVHLYGYFSSVAYYSIVYRDQMGNIISSIELETIVAGNSITLAPAMPSYQDSESIDTSLYAYQMMNFSKWQIVSASLENLGQFNAGASYTPTSSITIVPIYTVGDKYVTIIPASLTNGSYVAKVSGSQVGTSDNAFSVKVGTSVAYTITYTESENQKYTYTPASGVATSKSSTSATFIANYNATISVYSEPKSTTCLLPTSLVMLADGTEKMAKDLTMDDEILSFNHITGKFEASKISFNVVVDYHWFDVITLTFENGKQIELATGHGFFNMTTNRYEIYYGHEFEVHIGEVFATVEYVDGEFVIAPSKLVNVVVEKRYTQKVSPVSEYNINCIADGILTIPDDIEGMFDAFVFNSDLTIDVEAFQEDIMNYGLITYEEVSDVVPEYLFNTVNFQYFKIFIAKGYLSVDKVNHWIEAYLPYIIEQHNLDFDFENRVPLTKELLGLE